MCRAPWSTGFRWLLALGGVVSIATATVIAIAARAPRESESDLESGPISDNCLPVAMLLPPDFAGADAGKGGVRLILLSEPSGNERQAWFLLINSTDDPVTYIGYTPTSYTPVPPPGQISPTFRQEVRDQKGWRDQSPVGCGNGMGTLRMMPGEAGRFDVPWLGAQMFRIGLKYRRESADPGQADEIVWSEVAGGPATPVDQAPR